MSDDQKSADAITAENLAANDAHLTAVKHMVGMTLAGMLNSQRFGGERAIIGGTLLSIHNAALLYLMGQYSQGGRQQYEKARTMIVGIADTFRDELMLSIHEFEQRISEQELVDLEAVHIKGPTM